MTNVPQRLAAATCIHCELIEYHLRLWMLHNPIGDRGVQVAVHSECRFTVGYTLAAGHSPRIGFEKANCKLYTYAYIISRPVRVCPIFLARNGTRQWRKFDWRGLPLHKHLSLHKHPLVHATLNTIDYSQHPAPEHLP